MKRTLLYLAGILFLAGLIGTGVVAWAGYAVNTPQFDDERTVKLPAGSSMRAIQDSLITRGIVDRLWTFDLIAKATGWGSQIKSGHYSFASGLSNVDLLGTLRRGEETPVRMTIRPGTRIDFLARAVARQMAFSEEDFLSALRDRELAESLGTDTTHLFGYMLPDTYFFYWEKSPEDVIREVKKTFDAFYAQAAERSPGAPLGLSPAEVTNMAAIVEWESSVVEEKPTIAGVYLNRLRDRWALQADPTIQYAMIELEGSKRRLFNRDYRLDHPYNTYQYRGLPPGPVTNPSRSSIEAVLNPEAHRYFYFVAKGDGGHIFSRTLSEHRRNANNFFRLMRQRRAAAAQAGS